MIPKNVTAMNTTRFIIASVMFFFLVCPSFSIAGVADFNATSRTYVLMKEDARDEDYLAVYEFVDMDLYDIQNRRLNIHSGGWIRQHLDSIPFEDEDDDRTEQELTYAYLNYTPLENETFGTLQFKVGRQFLFSGPINEHIDGVFSKWDYKKVMGCSAYFGVPVDDENDETRLTKIFGGRAYYRILNLFEIGASYLRVEDNEYSQPYREEWGMDIWAQPCDFVMLQGWSTFNDKTDDVKENNYTLTFFPAQSLSVSAIYSHINYDDYFLPSFWDIVIKDISEGEELSKYGSRVNYYLNDDLLLTAEYIYHKYDIQDSANYYGGGITANDFLGLSTGASVYRMDGDTEDLRYTIVRLYGGRRVWKLDVVLDGSYLFLDESYADEDEALYIAGDFSYQVNRALRLSTTIIYREDRDVDHGAEAFFSMIFDF